GSVFIDRKTKHERRRSAEFRTQRLWFSGCCWDSLSQWRLAFTRTNSIETTFLRAAMLPGTHPASVENLLRRYVHVRLDFFRASADAGRAAKEQRAAKIQRELWTHAVQAGKESPSPIVTTFVISLNETIDFDATQRHALRTRVPGSVWVLVLAVAIVG